MFGAFVSIYTHLWKQVARRGRLEEKRLSAAHSLRRGKCRYSQHCRLSLRIKVPGEGKRNRWERATVTEWERERHERLLLHMSGLVIYLLQCSSPRILSTLFHLLRSESAVCVAWPIRRQRGRCSNYYLFTVSIPTNIGDWSDRERKHNNIYN